MDNNFSVYKTEWQKIEVVFPEENHDVQVSISDWPKLTHLEH